jgi:hypothetical protein
MNEKVIWSIKMETDRGEIIHSEKKDEWLTDLEMHYLARDPVYEDHNIVKAIKVKEQDSVLLARVRQELNDIIRNEVNNGA